MAGFIRKEEAMAFKDTIADPDVREMLMRAYGVLIFEATPSDVQGDFDLCFFFKVLSLTFCKKDEVISILRGADIDN